MTCGCCVEACPQYTKVDARARRRARAKKTTRRASDAAYDKEFVGAGRRSARRSCSTTTAPGKMVADDRMEALTGPGGIQACGNAQNCVAVCPKSIPLTTSIARAGRQATVYSIKKFFDR